MNRRKYILTTGGVIALAGCSGESEDEPPEEEEKEPEAAEEEEEEEQEEEEEEEQEEEEEEEEQEEEEEEGEETSIEVRVDWDYLEGAIAEEAQISYSGFSSIFSTNSEDRITHVGVRIEYPEENAAFSQSVDKSTADNEGILTLRTPPADNVNIYLTAVEYDSPVGSALLVAAESGTKIEEGATNQWVTDDFDWITTEWFVDEEYEDEYEEGKFYVDKNKERFQLPVHVTYPFHKNKDIDYRKLLVGVGKGWIHENTENYYVFQVTVDNPSKGEESTTNHTFSSYIMGEKFTLPETIYRIEQLGGFDVIWE